MSEEKIWHEDDALIMSWDAQENTNVQQPSLSESGCAEVHGGHLPTHGDDHGKDRFTRVTCEVITCKTIQR